MRKSLFLLLIGLVLGTLLLSGCGQEQQPRANKEDELILALGAEPEDGFDPTTGWGRYGSPLFQSTLLRRNQDLGIEMDLATEYSVSEDGMTWTVSLRDDVKFSDGLPLTATDVVFTFTTTKQSSSVVDLSVLEKVDAIDAQTVQFTLSHPSSAFVALLVSTGIVPQHAYGPDYSQDPLGSGPYILRQWDKGQQIIVEANPEYYGKKPYFKRLTFLFLETDAAFAAAKTGQLDIVAIPATLAEQNVEGMKLLHLESIDNRGIMFPYVPAGLISSADHPIGNNVTADLALRQAVNAAIDRSALVEGALNGYGTPAHTVSEKMPWWNPETVMSDGDPAQAARILADAGWEDVDEDGVLEKGNMKATFTLLYPATDSSRQALALAVSDMLKPVGIDVEVAGKSWDDIEKRMHADAVLFGWGSYDPMEMYNLYSSQKAGIGMYNVGYYSNDVVDDYMEKALASTTEEEAMVYWQKAQWDGETGLSGRGDAPWAWLVNMGHLYLVNEKLELGPQKIQPHGHGWPITDMIQNWHWQ
ncbi:MAG: ABC transporter substrate-binding protein, partial [Firmicutes bacterium]|nr:ABC transporter substrate-binding protein [Bacillota bacterium]